MKKIISNPKVKTIGIVLLTILCAILIIVLLGTLGKYSKNIGYNWIGNAFSFLIVFVTVFGVIVLNKKINGLATIDYGFHFKSIAKNMLLGIGLAMLIIALALIIANFIFEIPVEWTPLKKEFQKPLLQSLLVTFLVGLWEEVFFRGLIFNTFLKNNFGFHQSAIISTILFSLVHWSSFDMETTSWFWYLGIVFIGYILVLLYMYTNSIWSAVFFHFSWNFIVDLLNPEENKIGIFQITLFKEHSKALDNIETLVLGLTLLLLLFLIRKGKGSDKIKSYIRRISK